MTFSEGEIAVEAPSELPSAGTNRAVLSHGEISPNFEPAATPESSNVHSSSMSSVNTAVAEPETSSPEPGSAEGDPWAEGSPMPESAEPESWPEAGPSWDVAKSVWDEAWPFHVYFFAVAYLLIAMLAAYLAVTCCLQKGPRSSMNKTTIALNLMIWSFTTSRALFLLADPYFSENLMPFVAARLLWSFGIPGFTASFSIMLLILLDTTKMSLGPPRFQKVGTVVVIWMLHVLIVMLTDLLVIYVKADVRPLLVICQMLFVLYGVLVSVGYVYVGVKMRNNLQASSQGHEDQQNKRLRRLVVMTFLSSAVALGVAVLNVYIAFSQFGPYAEVTFVQPWPYWTVQTVSRIMEVAACSLVLMLFLRSGTGSHSENPCGNCLPWRRNRKAVGPKSVSNKITISTSNAVVGLQWRQRADFSTASSLPR